MTDLEKRFLKNTDDTGRFIYQSLVTGRKYYVEPIGGHSDWGDINPATKKVEGDYGEKYKGSVSEKESMITPENGINAAELADVIAGNSYSAAGGSVTVTVPAYNGVILTDKGHVKQVSVDEENLKPGFDPAYKIKAEERAVKVTGERE